MNIELLGLIWTVVATVVPAAIKMIQHKLVDTVWVKKHDNLDEVSTLIRAEVFGTIAVHIVAIIITIYEGNVLDVGIPACGEYIKTWLALIVLYIVEIIIVLNWKMVSKERKYIKNLRCAIEINVIMGLSLFISTEEPERAISMALLILLAILIFWRQFELNVKTEQKREVTYTIKTKNSKIPYIVHDTPQYVGGYVYISFRENKKEVKRIKIPESEILEVVYDIVEVQLDKPDNASKTVC